MFQLGVGGGLVCVEVFGFLRRSITVAAAMITIAAVPMIMMASAFGGVVVPPVAWVVK